MHKTRPDGLPSILLMRRAGRAIRASRHRRFPPPPSRGSPPAPAAAVPGRALQDGSPPNDPERITVDDNELRPALAWIGPTSVSNGAAEMVRPGYRPRVVVKAFSATWALRFRVRHSRHGGTGFVPLFAIVWRIRWRCTASSHDPAIRPAAKTWSSSRQVKRESSRSRPGVWGRITTGEQPTQQRHSINGRLPSHS